MHCNYWWRFVRVDNVIRLIGSHLLVCVVIWSDWPVEEVVAFVLGDGVGDVFII